MASVAEIVKEKEETQARRIARYEAEEAAEKKKQDSKQFSAEVAYIIKQFEYNCFDLDSSNNKVATFISGFSEGRHYITTPHMIPQSMPGYIEVKKDMSALKFEKDEDEGRKYIGGSSKYNKWKKALEDKFGVDIYIKREYTYSDRFDNDGYATYPDMHFQGVVARVQIKK